MRPCPNVDAGSPVSHTVTSGRRYCPYLSGFQFIRLQGISRIILLFRTLPFIFTWQTAEEYAAFIKLGQPSIVAGERRVGMGLAIPNKGS